MWLSARVSLNLATMTSGAVCLIASSLSQNFLEQLFSFPMISSCNYYVSQFSHHLFNKDFLLIFLFFFLQLNNLEITILEKDSKNNTMKKMTWMGETRSHSSLDLEGIMMLISFILSFSQNVDDDIGIPSVVWLCFFSFFIIFYLLSFF